jgi:hypothetical protein
MQTAEAPMASSLHFFGVMLGWVISYRTFERSFGSDGEVFEVGLRSLWPVRIRGLFGFFLRVSAAMGKKP